VFKKQPKWLIGFSDITLIHGLLYSQYKIASLHAPMAAAFNDGGKDDEYIGSLMNSLKGEKQNYKTTHHPLNRQGSAKGKLVGGNLSLLVNGIGTSSDIKTKNCILFLEDLDEQLYHIDRMFYQLKRSGKLEGLAGLIIGGFTGIKDTERPFGKTVHEAIQDIVAAYKYPVTFNFPVSHEKENVALKIGVKYKLEVTEGGTSLKEC
jgi:muramoyltetrapeptide carboxypeptidase